jgi:hypothetical protein
LALPQSANVARAEEEDAREIILRIPPSRRLQNQLVEQALNDPRINLSGQSKSNTTETMGSAFIHFIGRTIHP